MIHVAHLLQLAAALMLTWTGSEALMAYLTGHEDARHWALEAALAAATLAVLATVHTS